MKTILITGVSKGIGLALAKKFLAEGFSVIGTTTSGDKPFEDANLNIFQLDLSIPSSILACTEKIRVFLNDSAAKIDIHINNAGALFDDEETKVIVEKLRKTLEVDLIGTIDFTEQLFPLFNENAHIMNMSSMAGSLSDTDVNTTSHFPYHYPAYKISKCALNMYTRTLAMRMQHEDSRGIIVSSMHPGWVKTDMGGDEAPTTPEEAAKHIFDLAISRPETGQFWFEGQTWAW